jgi:malonate-semialdehyde dehydrogenase (acetylating)/methylmalonate-semialdehyde dehydrogenase
MAQEGWDMAEITTLKHYWNGRWVGGAGATLLDVANPATNETLAKVPLGGPAEMEAAVQAAQAAFPGWRRTPATERIQVLFKMKTLLEEHFDELARCITLENGKTLVESRGEMRRSIENVEVACGIPILMQSEFSEDIAPGVDEYMIRQPLGVVATIAPFNFPAMIAFWFLPYAVATGNTVIIKPSERCPITMHRVFELIETLGIPPGVVNLVNGAADAVNALLDHPLVRAVSFVGSTAVARHVYARGSASGKRVQAQGGAKNPVIILPDADLEMTTRIVADSVFGNAGQRCLAASLAVTVGETRDAFTQAIAAAAGERVVGDGLDPKTTMGPVISPGSKTRIEGLIEAGLKEGGELVRDGRGLSVPGYERGNFLGPTILGDIPPQGKLATTEVFGPVLGLIHVKTVDEAIDLVNRSVFGNMACLFTSSGAAARKFRYEAEAGNIGINIGVAAPMAFFPFSGWKDSFFGTLHGQARHAVEFFTQTKIVVERWPKEWSRQF